MTLTLTQFCIFSGPEEETQISLSHLADKNSKVTAMKLPDAYVLHDPLPLSDQNHNVSRSYIFLSEKTETNFAYIGANYYLLNGLKTRTTYLRFGRWTISLIQLHRAQQNIVLFILQYALVPYTLAY